PGSAGSVVQCQFLYDVLQAAAMFMSTMEEHNRSPRLGGYRRTETVEDLRAVMDAERAFLRLPRKALCRRGGDLFVKHGVSFGRHGKPQCSAGAANKTGAYPVYGGQQRK